MKPILRLSAIFALLALLALSTFAQSGPMSGTVINVDEGRGRLQVEYDEDGTRMTIETDAISTIYYGFGGVINGKPEIFKGSSGLSNVRVGDRVEVRGSERGEGVYKADRITLLGRNVPAGSVGVGTTRDPTNVATSTDDRPAGATTAPSGNVIEGTIRTINEDEGRLVIQTAQRTMINVRTYRNTPVLYGGQTYRVSNLEVGDQVRVEAESRGGQTDEISARQITVVKSVQETTAPSTGGRVTTIAGRVTRTEPGLDRVYVNDGREEVRVDMLQALDASGEKIRARDLRVDDVVEITGSFNRVGDMFNASTVRFTEPERTVPNEDPGTFDRPALITTGGTVTESLEDAATIGLRETDTNSVVRIWVSADFTVRTKAGTYILASALKEKDVVIIQAFRDGRGNLIAQTIRLRNR